jgi:SAM-dependent methyltransferase
MHLKNGYSCKLCSSTDCALFFEDTVRAYVRCAACGLVFVPPEYHVSIEEEKLRYGKHTNDKGDKKYVAYLSDIADEVLGLPVKSPAVLDFGSGPQHVLADIVNGRGVRCVPHDPLYGLTAEGDGERFDIVVACEVFEHLRDLAAEISFISCIVKPGGFVYVHTQLYDGVKDFSSWWYIKDVTHINFFCGTTMETVGEMMRRKIVSTDTKSTVIFGPEETRSE